MDEAYQLTKEVEERILPVEGYEVSTPMRLSQTEETLIGQMFLELLKESEKIDRRRNHRADPAKYE